jgi:hypothetical protein
MGVGSVRSRAGLRLGLQQALHGLASNQALDLKKGVLLRLLADLPPLYPAQLPGFRKLDDLLFVCVPAHAQPPCARPASVVFA